MISKTSSTSYDISKDFLIARCFHDCILSYKKSIDITQNGYITALQNPMYDIQNAV
jgi:hypothetical protein